MGNNFFEHRGTFMQVPHATEPNQSAAVILGVPFDCGNHPVRVGSRLGPASIREQSLALRAYDGESGVDPLTELKVVDLGDVRVIDGDVQSSYEHIEKAMMHAQKNGAVPVVFGGDGAIALPQMRALAKKHPDLCVLHLDAHTDAYPLEGYDNSTPFSRAAEEGLISPEHSFHIGMRRSHLVPGVYQHGKKLGYHLVPMKELLARGFSAVFDEVRQVIGSKPVYLCFDMDVF